MYKCALEARSFSRLHIDPPPGSPPKSALRRYYAVVPIEDIPEKWEDWLEVNARDTSDKGKVPKAIRTTLSEKPEWFAAYNRGLTVVASQINWDNKNNTLTLRFDKPEYHGVLDGGHTLRAIIDERSRLEGDALEGYCNIEIFTGLDESEIPSVVEARNTSKQVASKSLMNLDGSFEGLKKAIGETANLIAWKENEDGQFDVREVVGILTALDPTAASGGTQPIRAYSGKEACLKRFRDNPATFVNLFEIASDALEMWDWIQYHLPGHYNERVSGKFGALTGVQYTPKKPKELPFIGKTTDYHTPTGYIYPVLSAFRAMLVGREDGKWVWGQGISPIELIKAGTAADIFIASVRESINNYRNANRTGKDSQAWTSAYQAALILHLQHAMAIKN